MPKKAEQNFVRVEKDKKRPTAVNQSFEEPKSERRDGQGWLGTGLFGLLTSFQLKFCAFLLINLKKLLAGSKSFVEEFTA